MRGEIPSLVDMSIRKIKATIRYKYRTLLSEYREMGFKWLIKSLKHEVTYPFKRTYRFVVKLYTYAKLLWYDFEFDYVYLLKILQLKMRLMSEHMNESGMTVSSPVKAKELKFCSDLIDRIIKNEYSDLGHDKLEEKYGELKWESHPIENSTFVTMDIYREKAPVGTPEYEQEREESRKVFENAERQRKQDIEYLFDTMKKRLEGWWD
jgi:hypothetical protein